jgi:hypothetical protein
MIAGLPVLVTENCGYAQYVEQANAGLIVHIPYEQLALDDKLVELLTSPERDRWRQNGIAFGNRPDIYRLVETAVDRLEAFASGRYRRPTPKPEMAFCLLNYLPHGGMQRDFMRIALRCQEQGIGSASTRCRGKGAYPMAWTSSSCPLAELPTIGVTPATRTGWQKRCRRNRSCAPSGFTPWPGSTCTTQPRDVTPPRRSRRVGTTRAIATSPMQSARYSGADRAPVSC